MKKVYIKPTAEVINLSMEAVMLQASGVVVPGNDSTDEIEDTDGGDWAD